MGNQQSISENISNTVNRAMSSVITTNSSSCQQNTNSVQIIDIHGIKTGEYCGLNISGINQESLQTPNLTCAVSNDNSQKLQTDFLTKLKQEAEAVVSGLGGAVNSQAIANVLNNLANDISNNVSVTNTSRLLQNIISSNLTSLYDISGGCPAVCRNPNIIPPEGMCDIDVTDISQKITQAGIANFTSQNKNVTDIINTASSTIEQLTKSSNTGISFNIILIMIVAGIIIGCFMLYKFTKLSIKLILAVSIPLIVGIIIGYFVYENNKKNKAVKNKAIKNQNKYVMDDKMMIAFVTQT